MRLPAWNCGRAFWLVCACALLWPRLAAAGEPALAVDFDGDGRHDRVTLDQQQPSLLHIWLSASNTSQVLHSRRPLLRVAATDLDGDHHPELIARDSESKIHVWIHGRTGFLKYRRHDRLPGGLGAPVHRDLRNEDADSESEVRGATFSSLALLRGSPHAPRRDISNIGTTRRSRASRVLAVVSHFAPRPPPAPLPI